MRVLIVEDESRMASLVRQALEEETYAVDVIGDGREALGWLRQTDYDLIVLDVMLPGMDGLNVCRAYRDAGGRALSRSEQPLTQHDLTPFAWYRIVAGLIAARVISN